METDFRWTNALHNDGVHFKLLGTTLMKKAEKMSISVLEYTHAFCINSELLIEVYASYFT